MRDIRVLRARIENGPRVGGAGGFSYTTQGVTVRGRLGADARGTLTASAAGCKLDQGSWEAVKRRF